MAGNLKGLEAVVRSLNKEIKAIEGRSLKGLIRAAILIRRSMDYNSPLIPVDLGNLRASFFTVTSRGETSDPGGGFVGPKAGQMSADHAAAIGAMKGKISGQKPMVVLGFSANYAVFVHEMIKAIFQRPGAGAKWFQAALGREKPKILAIIKEEAKIK